jgi:hypothetical protein
LKNNVLRARDTFSETEVFGCAVEGLLQRVSSYFFLIEKYFFEKQHIESS